MVKIYKPRMLKCIGFPHIYTSTILYYYYMFLGHGLLYDMVSMRISMPHCL